MTASFSIRQLSTAEIADAAETLGAILIDAVDGNASLTFMPPVSLAEAANYWREVAAANDGRALLVVEDADGICGVVSVVPANGRFQPHRAEISKLIVHRRARGRGLATALMQRAEEEARRMGRSLLTLFTRHGVAADQLYLKLGWTRAGVIPNDSLKPDGTFCDAAIFYKQVG